MSRIARGSSTGTSCYLHVGADVGPPPLTALRNPTFQRMNPHDVAFFLEFLILTGMIADITIEGLGDSHWWRRQWKRVARTLGSARIVPVICVAGLPMVLLAHALGTPLRSFAHPLFSVFLCWCVAKCATSRWPLLPIGLIYAILTRIAHRRPPSTSNPHVWLSSRRVPLKHVRFDDQNRLAEVQYGHFTPTVRSLRPSQISHGRYEATLWHEIGHILDSSVLLLGCRIYLPFVFYLDAGYHSLDLQNQLNGAREFITREDHDELCITHRRTAFNRAELQTARLAPTTKRRLTARLARRCRRWDRYAATPIELFAQAVSLRMTQPEQLRSAAPPLYDALTSILQSNGIAAPNES